MHCFRVLAVLLLGSCCLASPDPERIAKAYNEIVQRENRLDRNTTFAHFRTSQPDLGDEQQPPMTALPYHPLAIRLRDTIYELPEMVALAKVDPDSALQMAKKAMGKLPERQQLALNKLPSRAIGGDRPIVENKGKTVLPPELHDIINRMALRSYMCEKLDVPEGTSVQALLSYAVEREQHTLIDYLIWMGADPNYIDEKGQTLLLHAIASNEDEHVIERLLFYGADKSHKPNGIPLLVPAIMCRLLNAHWFFNPTDALYKTRDSIPLTYYTAIHGDLEMTKRLCAAGAEIRWVSSSGVPLVCLVAQRGMANMVKYLIEEQSADPNSQSHTRSCLWFAVDRGDPETVNVLLEAGADPNQMAPSFNHRTLLQFAVWMDESQIAHDLIEHGAHIDVESASELLREAIYWSDLTAVRLLLERGLDPNVVEHSSLFRPVRLRQWDLASLLVEHGANPNGYVDSPIYRSDLDADQIIWLLHHGADPDVPGYRGETWLQTALRDGDDALIDALLQHGAKVSVSSRLALMKRGIKKMLK